MQREFTVSDQPHLKRLSTYILNCLRKQEKLTVIVKPFSPDISAAQRGLYWQWMTDLGQEFGDSKEYYHNWFKGKFLVNIFRRDDEKYDEMVKAVLSVRDAELHGIADILAQRIVDFTSITKADKKQMAEYMENIKNYAQGEMGFAVRQPDDGLLNY